MNSKQTDKKQWRRKRELRDEARNVTRAFERVLETPPPKAHCFIRL